VTFNYDTLLEDGLSTFGVNIADISHYISNDSFKLFKLHGSVNWAKVIETPIERLDQKDDASLTREIIDRAPELRISDRYQMVLGNNPSRARTENNVPLYPAVAIPVETKSNFECQKSIAIVLARCSRRLRKFFYLDGAQLKCTFSKP
jgi:hypothetical protein